MDIRAEMSSWRIFMVTNKTSSLALCWFKPQTVNKKRQSFLSHHLCRFSGFRSLCRKLWVSVYDLRQHLNFISTRKKTSSSCSKFDIVTWRKWLLEEIPNCHHFSAVEGLPLVAAFQPISFEPMNTCHQ